MGYQVVGSIFWVVLAFGMQGIVATAADEECRVTRCSHRGPEIRFPFWLKDKQHEHCGHPGFQLTCDNGTTMLQVRHLANTSLDGTQLFLSAEASVVNIDYTSQVIQWDTFHLTSNLELVPASTSISFPVFFNVMGLMPPYSTDGLSSKNISFVSCPSRIGDEFYRDEFIGYEMKADEFIGNYAMLTALSGQAFRVYYSSDSTRTSDPSITSCTKVFNSSIPLVFSMFDIKWVLHWFTPNCTKCEAKGEYCKLEDRNTSYSEIADHGTTCFSIGVGHRSIKPIAGIIPGAILIVIVLVVLFYYFITSYRQKQYDRLKIEMFLEDYKAMKPTRYTYADIKKITGQFSDKLGKGGYGSVYKGRITNDIIVAVKVLNSDPKAKGEDFINEVGTIGRIHHVNVVRLVGYCADGCNRALVYEFQPNNSLEKFTYSSKNHGNNFLGWEKMQEIALGICKGIEYLHQGCAQQILHFDIKPHNILLDQNFNPKISDFGLAKLCSKDQSVVSMTVMRGTIGYIAPEVFSRNFGKVSSKSDVYSFGMLLLEMVGARDNNASENTSETYFPEWIFHRLEEGGEVAIEIEKEKDSNIAKKLTIVGLWCIGWHPVDRPSMKHVIQMLEREDCPPMPPNPFGSSNVRPFTTDLEVISEAE